MEQTQETFTWVNIRDHLINREGIRVGRDIIRKILIDRFHYSFKRWSPRLLKHDRRISKLKKILYTVKICKILHKSAILINVDKSTFSQSTKSNYSWSRRGQPSNLSSIIFKGSISIISAIMSNGMSFTGIRVDTIKSKTFVEYIGHLLSICKKQ